METNLSAEENYRGVWGQRIGFGKHPVLLVIDFVQAYTEKQSPLYASGVPSAVAETIGLLVLAREHGIPVVHTTIVHSTPSFVDGGLWLKKSPVVTTMRDKNYSEVCPGVEPLQTELVIRKQYASAFFGTTLASTLTAAGADTIVMAGCTTSGCVRASAVDGVQHGFRVIVPRECVGDRHPDPHNANLFDIDSKYGDVVEKADVMAYFETLSAALPQSMS